MPSYLVKRAPDKDEYLEFSTVVDHPITYPMKRSEMKAFLDEEFGRRSIVGNDERLERADENGTSAMWPRLGPTACGGWEDDDFWVRVEDKSVTEYPGRWAGEHFEDDVPECWRMLTREELFEYMHRRAADDPHSRESEESP